jgi:hypothetical protein
MTAARMRTLIAAARGDFDRPLVETGARTLHPLRPAGLAAFAAGMALILLLGLLLAVGQ